MVKKEENRPQKSNQPMKVINNSVKIHQPQFFCSFFVGNEKSLSGEILKGLILLGSPCWT